MGRANPTASGLQYEGSCPQGEAREGECCPRRGDRRSRGRPRRVEGGFGRCRRHQAALAKKKADLEAKIADLEKEFDVEKKMLKHDLEVTRERLQKEIAGLQKELNKESKKVDKAVMDLGLLEFRVATAEQEKITLDQRIQAHKAELKQQQAFIAKLEAEKA